MIVMKFGGSSLKDAESIINVINIIKTKISYKPVIVASAMGKTTRNLLNCCLAAANQNQTDCKNILELIKNHHCSTAEKLGLKSTNAEFKETIDLYFMAIETNLAIIGSENNLDPKMQDSTLAYGELLSTLILYSSLQSKNLNAELLDARECIITDGHFTHATPLIAESRNKIREYFRRALSHDQLAVIQGYIGSTEYGQTTTLGFEGSDYSAVLIGSALHVKEIQIWKDVPGVMSADPAMISKAIPVESMTFAEAAELSRCGAKVLHPSTIRPAMERNILVKIFNSRQPDFKGTTIDNRSNNIFNPIKSITCRRNLIILQITAKQSLSEFDFSAQVFVTLQDLEISPDIIEGSDKKVILIIKKTELKETLFNRISQWADLQIEESKATISLIGNMIRNQHDVIEKINKYEKLQSIQFDIDKTSEHSYTILLNESDLDNTMQNLHYDIFETVN
jgi:aspartate kinase